MISKKIQKILSGIIIATYLVFYCAPMGLCVSNIPMVKAGVQQPALRGENQSASIKLESEVILSKKNPKISLSLRDSDVQQVLRMLADKAGLNIIFHSSVPSATDKSGLAMPALAPLSGTTNANSPQPATQNQQTAQNNNNNNNDNTNEDNIADAVSPKVTLDLVNVPLNDAFRMITQVSGLVYYLDNNTIVVMSAKASKKLNFTKKEMMTIPVNYVNAGALAEFLNKNIFQKNKPGLTNSQVAVTNPNKNEILIFGTKNDYLMAKKIVAQFDTKPLEQTFAVNHTTPKEMATLICTTLFNYEAPSTNDSAAASTNASLSLGEVVLACRDKKKINIEESAADSNTNQSSSNNSSDSSSSNKNDLYSINNNGLSVLYNSQKGTISVVGGSAQQLSMIKEFIVNNDKKQPQAYLEISIIELNETGSKEFNNTWNIYSGFFSGTFNGETKTSSNYPSIMYGYDQNGLPVSKYTGPGTITYAIDYLIKNEKGRVLANPKIVITNGQTSKIDLSSDYVKTVASQIITNSTSGTPSVQRTYTIGADEGIMVEMTPFISPDGYVTMNIKPSYSTEKGPIREPNAIDPTIIDTVGTLLQRRNLDLKNIRIKDGETFVIGGMMRETETKSISKFPLLGDLPGIGMFFRNSKTEREKNELVIMITPKIIKDSEDIVTNPNTAL